MDSERADLGSERADLSSERADLDSERADLDSGRAEFGLLCCHLVYRARELGDGPGPSLGSLLGTQVSDTHYNLVPFVVISQCKYLQRFSSRYHITFLIMTV